MATSNKKKLKSLERFLENKSGKKRRTQPRQNDGMSAYDRAQYRDSQRQIRSYKSKQARKAKKQKESAGNGLVILIATLVLLYLLAQKP